MKKTVSNDNLVHSVAKAIMNNLLGIVEKNLKKEKRLQIIGFGSFYTQKQEARTAINPNTRKPIQVPEKKVVKFVLGKALREAETRSNPPCRGKHKQNITF